MPPRSEADFIHVAGMTYGEIVRFTEAHGHRPTIPCAQFCGREGCTDLFRVHCGAVRKAYLAKVSKDGTELSAGGSCGMTAEHAEAQNIVRTVLTSGKRINVHVKCAQSHCERTFVYPVQVAPGQECVCESYFKDKDTSRKHFADVAIRKCDAPKDETGIVCVIEVYHTHYTPECNRRNIGKWFEVRATDVLRQQEELQTCPDYILTLNCQRMLKKNIICIECQKEEKNGIPLWEQAYRERVMKHKEEQRERQALKRQRDKQFKEKVKTQLTCEHSWIIKVYEEIPDCPEFKECSKCDLLREHRDGWLQSIKYFEGRLTFTHVLDYSGKVKIKHPVTKEQIGYDSKLQRYKVKGYHNTWDPMCPDAIVEWYQSSDGKHQTCPSCKRRARGFNRKSDNKLFYVCDNKACHVRWVNKPDDAIRPKLPDKPKPVKRKRESDRCIACNGTGVSYFTDGIYAACMECSNVTAPLTKWQQEYAESMM